MPAIAMKAAVPGMIATLVHQPERLDELLLNPQTRDIIIARIADHYGCDPKAIAKLWNAWIEPAKPVEVGTVAEANAEGGDPPQLPMRLLTAAINPNAALASFVREAPRKSRPTPVTAIASRAPRVCRRPRPGVPSRNISPPSTMQHSARQARLRRSSLRRPIRQRGGPRRTADRRSWPIRTTI